MTGNPEICLRGSLCQAPLIPFITGDIAVGGTLTGQLIANVMYQWMRDDGDIPGATSSTYVLTASDVGHLIRVRMIFTDADNNYVSVISKPVAPGGGAPAGPVTFQSVNGTGIQNSPVTTAMPSGVSSGNLLISMAYAPLSNAVFSISAGWTIIDQVNSAAFSGASAYRVATGSGDAPTWSWTGGGQAASNVSRFTGNSATTPIGNHSVNNGSGTTITATAIISAGGGTFHLDMISRIAQSIPLPSGWSETSNYTLAPAEHMSHKDVPMIGTSSGVPSVTITSTDWLCFLTELRSQ